MEEEEENSIATSVESSSSEEMAPVRRTTESSGSSDESKITEEEEVFVKTQALATEANPNLGAVGVQEEQKLPHTSNASSMYRRVDERLSQVPMKHGHPILPYGMNQKTLYDDAKYDKWYYDYIASKPKTFEELAKKRMRKNQRARVRARIR